MLRGLTKDRPDAATGISALRFFGSAGLKVYLPFTSGSLIDFSGKGANATSYNSPYYKGGVRGIGNAYAFTGSQTSANFLQLSGTSNATVKNLGACSMSFWAVYYTDPSGVTAAFYEELADSWGTPLFSTILNTSGQIIGIVRTSNTTSYTTTAYTLSKGMWHHIVLTFSGVNNRLRMFVDGRYLYYTATLGGYVDNLTSVKINIGARKTSASDDSNTRSIEGFMTEIAVFDYELQTREISAYYKFATAQLDPPVTRYFPSLYVAPQSALRQRVSKPQPKVLSLSTTRTVVSPIYARNFLTLENSALQSFGHNYSPGTGTGVTYTSCPPLGGGAVTFAGNSGSHVSLGSSTVPFGDTVNTVSFWIRWDHLTTGQSLTSGWENTNHIFSTNAVGTGTVIMLQYLNPSHATAPDKFTLRFYQYSGSIWRENRSPVLNAEVGKWTHFAIRHDPFDYNNIRWYKNGELMGENTNSGGNWSSFASSTSEFRIGWCNTSSSYPSGFAGAMRDFMVHNRLVTPKQVKDYYTARLNQPSFSLPAIYTTKDLAKVRAVMHNQNKAEFLVKGDIRSSI